MAFVAARDSNGSAHSCKMGCGSSLCQYNHCQTERRAAKGVCMGILLVGVIVMLVICLVAWGIGIYLKRR